MAGGRLDGKVALVTGASRGIGAAIARRLAADGAKVVVNYAHSPEAAAEVVAAINTAGGQAVAVRADLSRPDEIPGLLDAVRAQYGRLDIHVNNAGVMKRGVLEEVTAADIDFHFATNVRGLLLVTREAARLLPRGGCVVNVSSAITRLAYPGSVVYSATKAAIDMITQVLAVELGPRGIRVNTISPGSTRTDMNSEKSGKTKEEERREIENTPLARIGTPEDIADAAALLASDDARWVTGAKLDCAGGLRG
jgi:3-oxoacyl-[acyl-carrier protein] reductase